MSTDVNAFRWVNWRVRGDEPTLAQTLDIIDASLPAGWCREPVGDTAPPRVARQYRFHPEGSSVPWSVPIYRWTGLELQSGTVHAGVQPHTSPGVRPQALVSGLVRFLDEVIVPAATQAGATVYDPTPVELFFDELPLELRYQLDAFGAKVRKSLPLDWKEAEAWDELVVAAYRSSEIFDDERLAEWFESRGWSGADAKELVGRFFDGCRLLGHYRDTLVIV